MLSMYKIVTGWSFSLRKRPLRYPSWTFQVTSGRVVDRCRRRNRRFGMGLWAGFGAPGPQNMAEAAG